MAPEEEFNLPLLLLKYILLIFIFLLLLLLAIITTHVRCIRGLVKNQILVVNAHCPFLANTHNMQSCKWVGSRQVREKGVTIRLIFNFEPKRSLQGNNVHLILLADFTKISKFCILYQKLS